MRHPRRRRRDRRRRIGRGLSRIRIRRGRPTATFPRTRRGYDSGSPLGARAGFDGGRRRRFSQNPQNRGTVRQPAGGFRQPRRALMRIGPRPAVRGRAARFLGRAGVARHSPSQGARESWARRGNRARGAAGGGGAGGGGISQSWTSIGAARSAGRARRSTGRWRRESALWLARPAARPAAATGCFSPAA